MTETENNNPEVKKLVDCLFEDESTLREIVEKNPKAKEQLIPIIESIIISKSKDEMKDHFRKFVKKLEEFGEEIENFKEEIHQNNGVMFWSGAGNIAQYY